MTGCIALLRRRGEPRNPTTAPPSALTRSRSSRTSRLLPMPGSPLITVTCPAPVRAASQQRSKTPISVSRPTNTVLRRPPAASSRLRRRRLPAHDEQRHRLVDATQRLGAERVDRDETIDQGSGTGRDHHLPGLGHTLHARRDVEGLADDVGRHIGRPATHLADDDEPGMDADTDREVIDVQGGGQVPASRR